MTIFFNPLKPNASFLIHFGDQLCHVINIFLSIILIIYNHILLHVMADVSNVRQKKKKSTWQKNFIFCFLTGQRVQMQKLRIFCPLFLGLLRHFRVKCHKFDYEYFFYLVILKKLYLFSDLMGFPSHFLCLDLS